ncbi:MAG: NINE protein [Sulfobacillus sp.]
MKNKITAGILAILLGNLGAHKFYLGKTGQGILYLLFCWTFIPGLIGLIEGITYLTQSDDAWNAQWNGGARAGTAPSPHAVRALTQLDALRQSGGLSEEEYQAKKQSLLDRI